MGSLIIYDNIFLRQFEVEIGEELAKIEYALQDRKIFLTKLIIPSSNDDEKFEEIFIREVFEIIKERNIRIMPTSTQIRKFIKKNKEFRELLPIGIRL
ncbi:MAG: N-acetyltransferase [Bacteroidetes bacterium]|nr:N-acetyltransferase [Bacteroidota bacterium]